jgi:putative NIF3 family GTP cyclohydrolase 1 type 2
MSTPTIKLDKIVDALTTLFEVNDLNSDPSMSRFLPTVYNSIDFNWEVFFAPDFVQRFNGLMIRGDQEVANIYCAVFPTPEVISRFISEAQNGDLLFLHHPIDLQCGSPDGIIGQGFLPIDPKDLIKIKEKKCSVYTCHAPMDTNKEIGTNEAIVEALEARVIDEFLPYGNGYAGRICEIESIGTNKLVEKTKKIFSIPQVDFAGKRLNNIRKIAIVAGGGDDMDAMKESEQMSAQAYITGEIHSYHSGEWGKNNTERIDQWAQETKMSLIGVSHAASEFLTMKIQMVPYFRTEFNINADVIQQSIWWR